MLAYILRRLALVIPTLLGIMIVNFAIVQAAPGGPVERLIAELQGRGVEATARLTNSSQGELQRGGGGGQGQGSTYRGARGLDPAFVKQLEKLYGFDQPAWRRFTMMI